MAHAARRGWQRPLGHWCPGPPDTRPHYPRVNPFARLIFPALRWRKRSGFGHERARIENYLELGIGGFILFGGTADAARSLSAELRASSQQPLLIGSDFERGGGQQFEGLTHLPPPAALGFLNDIE